MDITSTVALIEVIWTLSAGTCTVVTGWVLRQFYRMLSAARRIPGRDAEVVLALDHVDEERGKLVFEAVFTLIGVGTMFIPTPENSNVQTLSLIAAFALIGKQVWNAYRSVRKLWTLERVRAILILRDRPTRVVVIPRREA